MRGVICVLLAVSLIGCSPAPSQPQARIGAETIECALDGSTEFKPECLVERDRTDGATVLTVRHPDGSFRRLEQLTDGRGLAAWDGADSVVRTAHDDMLTIEIADDRYRFLTIERATDASAE